MNARRLSRLVKQQFWFFGWDIRRPVGNLLLELGFQRTPNPDATRAGSTRYHAELSSGDTVTLWGFGVCWSTPDRGSIYVSRLKPEPIYLETCNLIPEAWQADIVNTFNRAGSPRERVIVDDLTLRLVNWVIAYETEIFQRCGDDYRQQAIAAWRDPLGDPLTLLQSWQELRDQLAAGALIGAAAMTTGPLPIAVSYE